MLLHGLICVANRQLHSYRRFSFHLIDNPVNLGIRSAPGIRGTLPTSYGQLTQLKSLVLADSGDLTGNLPSELGNIGSTLTNLNFAGAGFTGTVPTEIGRLTGLCEYSASISFYVCSTRTVDRFVIVTH